MALRHFILLALNRPVCLDAVIKSISNFPKVGLKVTKAGFCLKVAYFKVTQKVDKYLGNL